MSEVTKFLEENPLIYLATLGLDGEAKVRPILYYFEEDNSPYFCTANNKPVFKEISADPNVEITTATKEFRWIRITGEVEFKDDLNLKQKVIDANELVKSLYKTPDNPVFEVFTIHGKATIADFSGEPPKTYEL